MAFAYPYTERIGYSGLFACIVIHIRQFAQVMLLAPAQCPHCGSELLTTLRWPSGNEQPTNSSLTDGVHPRSQGHPVGRIYCLVCDGHWDPAQATQVSQPQTPQQRAAYQKQWRSQFFTAYENDNLLLAERILSEAEPYLLRWAGGVSAAYQSLKADRQSERITWWLQLAVAAMGLLLLFSLYLVFG